MSTTYLYPLPSNYELLNSVLNTPDLIKSPADIGSTSKTVNVVKRLREEYGNNIELNGEKTREYLGKSPGALDTLINYLKSRIPDDVYIRNFSNTMVHLLELGAIGVTTEEHKEKAPKEIIDIENKEFSKILDRYKETLGFLESIKKEIPSNY
jgi:hypothetical protein